MIIVYNIPIISSININQVIKMTVTWQGVCAAVMAQFSADDSINFATTANMSDELINKAVHGMIALAIASPTNLTKLKWAK